MEIMTASSGSYPRVGESPGQLRLRKAYRDWEKDKVSDEELEEVYRDYTKEVIREQEEAGLDVVTDGQLRWYDPLSHLAKGIGGCEINGLLRYFDTNFYFRQPVVVEDLGLEEPIVKDEFVFARDVSRRVLKPVITGPYTLAKYSIDRHYGDFSDLVSDFSKIIAREVGELADAGAKEIQVDEPGILRNKEDFSIFSEAIERVADTKGESRLGLYVYYGDSSPLYERFQRLPVDLLGLDFTYSPDLPDLIEEKGSGKALGLGLIDARNTKIENPDTVLSILERVVPRVDADRVYLNPTSGIELLPRTRAFEKVENMVDIVGRAKEVLE